jgi:signal peptidase I
MRPSNLAEPTRRLRNLTMAISIGSKTAASRELLEEVVRSFGEVRLRVSGSSMLPSILPSDVITVRRASIDEVSVGDVVLFAQNERFFAHRVVSKIGDAETHGLITRGDTLCHEDAPIAASQLLGRVKSIERGNQQRFVFAGLRGWQRWMSIALRSSDFGVSVYLRLVSWLRTFSQARAPSQP